MSQATRLDLPFAVTGCIDKAGDQDRFSFAARKSQKLFLQVQSASLGFALDPWLRIEDPKGKELAKSDDSVNADPVLEWTPGEDGTFVAAVGNVLNRGGPDYLYRLTIRQPLPELKAVVADNEFRIEPGKTNEIKVTVTGFHDGKSKLSISAKGLPAELKVEPVDVPDKKGEIALKLVASPEAKPFSGPIQIVVTAAESGREHRAIAELITSSVNNGVPNGFNKLVIESTEQLWLTVLPAAVSKAASAK